MQAHGFPLARFRGVALLASALLGALAEPAVAEAAGNLDPAVKFARASDIVGEPVVVRPTAPNLKTSGTNPKASARQGSMGPSGIAWPVRSPLDRAALTSGFGSRWHPVIGGYRSHLGIDLAAPVGTPVFAPSAGVVRFAQWYGGYGLFVVVDHGQGLLTRYGHLSQVNVVVGQQVDVGDLLALVGSTGLSTGPHLHYEVWLKGRPVDPLQFTPGP